MTSVSIRPLLGERTSMFSPVGLRLVDEFTGEPPIGEVNAKLEVNDSGAWRPTEIRDVRTPGGLIVYPGLGRRSDLVGLPPTLYRIVVDAEYYRPLYPRGTDGFEFPAYPSNDTSPPSVIATPTKGHLLPAASYPFPASTPVLRGLVRLKSGALAVDASVTDGNRRKALTDEQGEFALPLRWARPGPNHRIDAEDQAGRQRGSIRLKFPEDLLRSHIITLS